MKILGLINNFSKKKHYLIILAFSFLAYFPTFSGGFILDDIPLITKNPYIKEFHTLKSYLSQEDGVVGEDDKGEFHTGYYRPLINITYTIDYKIWGMNGAGFRTTNFIMHLLCCFMLYNLLYLLLGDKISSFWITLLFSLHPVNTESVSWVISRNNILVTFFILLCLYLYILNWNKKNYLLWTLSLLSFMAALFSKEFGVMLLPIMFLLHRFILKKKSLLIEFLQYLPFVILLALYFILRKNVIESYVTPFDTSHVFHNLILSPFLIIKNLILVFLPHKLHYLYVSYPGSILDVRVILSILAFMAAMLLMWALRKKKVILFSFFSFIICLFPVLNIIPSASKEVTLVSLRWLYLPMTFLALGIASFLKDVREVHQKILYIFFIIVVLYFGMYTHILNRYLWHDEKTFFEQEVYGFNNDFFAGDLAEKYLDEGRHREAEMLFKIAIDKYSSEPYYFINYSALLLQTGRPEDAIAILDRAKDLKLTQHKRGEWFNNMGAALFMMNKRTEALSYFNKAVSSAPEEVEFWKNMAEAYGIMGEYEKSIEVAEKGLMAAHDSEKLLVTVAMGYFNLNKFEKTREVIGEIPEDIKNSNPIILNILEAINR